MDTITITFPEVKVNLGIDEATFDTIENTVFNTVQHIGRKVIEKVLLDIDNILKEKRPKGVLENTGKRGKYFLTRLGDIRYKRNRYIDKKTGKSRYLLEEKLGIKKNQRISLSRAKIEVSIASMSPYRETKKISELLTGYQRSHEAIRQSVIKEAKGIISYQEHAINKMKRLEGEEKAGSSAPEIAYIETDEAYIRLQRRRKRKQQTKQRKKRRRSLAIKMGIGYTGREARYRSGRRIAQRLTEKFAYISIANGRRFMEDLSLIAEKKMALSEGRHIFVGGDGDQWITKGIKDFFPGAKYLLCLFHLYRNIKRALCYRKDEQKIIKKLVREDKIDSALNLIEDMMSNPRDEKEKESLGGLYHYIRENRNGINVIRHIEEKKIREKVKGAGAIEPNIDKIIAHRFKKRGMSWSVRGALSLLKVKETILNGEWENWWYEKRDEKIEINLEPLKQLTAKDFWKKRKSTIPLIEATIPALEGPEPNKPWVKVLRELQSIDYYK